MKLTPTENHRIWRHKYPEKAKAWRKRARRARHDRNQDRLYEHFGRKCKRCGEFKPGRMDFDHMDPATKNHTVSDLLWQSWTKVAAEIPLLQLLCRDCHMLKTKEQGDHLFRRGSTGVSKAGSDDTLIQDENPAVSES